MKFYRENNKNINYWNKILINKLTAILLTYDSCILFYKNGEIHNEKNAADIHYLYKLFYLKDKNYGAKYNKFSWCRFVKLQAFL